MPKDAALGITALPSAFSCPYTPVLQGCVSPHSCPFLAANYIMVLLGMEAGLSSVVLALSQSQGGYVYQDLRDISAFLALLPVIAKCCLSPAGNIEQKFPAPLPAASDLHMVLTWDLRSKAVLCPGKRVFLSLSSSHT